jgi:Zn-dependent protease with chaperone function
MKSLVIKNKGRQTIPTTIIIGLVSLPVLAGLFFQEQVQSALFYCRETIIFQYGTHPLMIAVLAILVGVVAGGFANVLLLWWRELTQTRSIRRWTQLRLRGEHEGIYLVEAEEALAITVGYVHPIIIYSTGLQSLLTNKEIEAVLAHEVAHQMRRDPLRRLALYSLMKFCWFWPALAVLARYYISQQEVRADLAAMQSVGQQALTHSIKKVLSAMVTPQAAGLSGCAFSFDPERLLAPTAGARHYQFQASWSEIVGSAISLIGMLVVVILSTVSVQAKNVETADQNQLCQYVVEHSVKVGFSPLLHQSLDNFEPAQDAYFIWQP